jgi:hypothetical protein
VAPTAGCILQRACACGKHAGNGGECAECRKKRLGLQRRAVGNGPDVAPPIVHEVLRSPGRPLDDETRGFMESRFGHDFSRVPATAPRLATAGLAVGPTDDPFEREAERQSWRVMNTPARDAHEGTSPGPDFSLVRVHIGQRAAESARSVSALAYTVGEHIIFGTGQFAPDSTAGRQLLAHELVHVVQQSESADQRSILVQRQPLQSTQSPQPLTPSERTELMGKGRFNMNRAYVEYSRAADAVQRSIKAVAAAAAAARGTFWSLLFDVGMGLLAPGLAARIASIADKIPVAFSKLSYRVGIWALNETGVQRIFAAATKIGKETIKSKVASLAGESDSDKFIKQLVSQFGESIQAVNDDMPNKSDQELAIIAARYHTDAANEAVFTSEIEERVRVFALEVLNLSSKWLQQQGRSVFETPCLIWVQVGKAEYLAQASCTPKYWVHRWIGSVHKDAAFAITGKREHEIPTVPWKELRNPERVASARNFPTAKNESSIRRRQEDELAAARWLFELGLDDRTTSNNP